LIEALRAERIGTSVHYIPTHHFSGYRALIRHALPTTDRVWRGLISLPLYPAMSDRDVEDVIEALERSLSRPVFASA
jgi:perosamine synthetase